MSTAIPKAATATSYQHQTQNLSDPKTNSRIISPEQYAWFGYKVPDIIDVLNLAEKLKQAWRFDHPMPLSPDREPIIAESGRSVTPWKPVEGKNDKSIVGVLVKRIVYPWDGKPSYEESHRIKDS